MSPPARIRVLHTLPAPDGRTRFVDQMLGGASPGVDVRTFSWRTALFGTYDVFHIHWPEYLTRHRTAVGSLAKRALTIALLTRIRLSGIAIVRTAHNLDPHERGGWLDSRLLRAIDARTDYWIRLNPTTTLPSDARATTILHGHYRDRFATPDVQQQRGRILQFGLIRPYKGIEQLLAAFALLNEQDLTLRIVGKPVAGALDSAIKRAAAADQRISHDLRFVEDNELAEEVAAAELVVLPYLEMHNSGALLVALSLDRPVLVPRSPANQALSDEVGPGWVIMFDGELQAAQLRAAVSDARRPRASRPNLSGRDWTEVGRLHELAYREALGRGYEEGAGTSSASRSG